MTRGILIDLTSDAFPSLTLIGRRVSHRGLTIAQYNVQATFGMWVGVSHLSLIAHEGEPCEFGWKSQETQRTERHVIRTGQFNLLPPDQLFHADWIGDQRILGIAFTTSFIERTVSEAFEGRIPDLKLMVAIDNPAISKLIDCLRQTMEKTNRTDLIYLDHIGAMLALKLHEFYGDVNPSAAVTTGGLGSSRQRRVVDYIETHLGEDLNLASLAAEAGLRVQTQSDPICHDGCNGESG